MEGNKTSEHLNNKQAKESNLDQNAQKSNTADDDCTNDTGPATQQPFLFQEMMN